MVTLSLFSSVGIATGYRLDGPGIESRQGEIFRRPDWPWSPSLLHNGYFVFSGGKVRPGRAADHSPPSNAAIMEEQSYTSTRPLGLSRSVMGLLYLFFSVKFITNMGTVTRLRAGRSGVRISFLKCPDGHRGQTNFTLVGYWELFSGIKRPRREAYHLSPSRRGQKRIDLQLNLCI